MITTEGNNYVSDTILTEEELLEKIQVLKKQGKKIGLCSGSFDLLHPGHITHLMAAKKECDVLVVSVAPDSYNAATRKKKGRPIFTHAVRAFAISQLKAVDFVLIKENSRQAIELLKPSMYFKGIDYNDLSDPVLKLEKNALEAHGGKLIFTKTEKLGTTDIINYIKDSIE